MKKPKWINIALNDFEKAVRNHQEIGAHRPSEMPVIEAEYKLARAKMEQILVEMEEQNDPT